MPCGGVNRRRGYFQRSKSWVSALYLTARPPGVLPGQSIQISGSTAQIGGITCHASSPMPRQNMVLLEFAQSWARRKTPLRFSSRWLGDGTTAMDCPHPGTTQYPHLIENSGAPQVRLTDNELREIDAALARSHCRAVAQIRLPKVSLIKLNGDGHLYTYRHRETVGKVSQSGDPTRTSRVVHCHQQRARTNAGPGRALTVLYC